MLLFLIFVRFALHFVSGISINEQILSNKTTRKRNNPSKTVVVQCIKMSKRVKMNEKLSSSQ